MLSLQDAELAITSMCSGTMKFCFYQIALHVKDLFSYIKKSKNGLFSVFVHQYWILLLFAIQKMEHTCFKMPILILFAQ